MGRTILGALALLCIVGIVRAAPNPTIGQSVAVCDPFNPSHCITVNSSGVISFTNSNPAATYSKQIVIAVTSTAVCFPSQAMVNGMIVKAKSTNTGNGFVGSAGVTTTDDGTGNGYRLLPGEAWSGAVTNMSAVCVNGTAGDVYYGSGN